MTMPDSLSTNMLGFGFGVAFFTFLAFMNLGSRRNAYKHLEGLFATIITLGIAVGLIGAATVLIPTNSKEAEQAVLTTNFKMSVTNQGFRLIDTKGEPPTYQWIVVGLEDGCKTVVNYPEWTGTKAILRVASSVQASTSYILTPEKLNELCK
jgi:hypothetical protein